MGIWPIPVSWSCSLFTSGLISQPFLCGKYVSIHNKYANIRGQIRGAIDLWMNPSRPAAAAVARHATQCETWVSRTRWRLRQCLTDDETALELVSFTPICGWSCISLQGEGNRIFEPRPKAPPQLCCVRTGSSPYRFVCPPAVGRLRPFAVLNLHS